MVSAVFDRQTDAGTDDRTGGELRLRRAIPRRRRAVSGERREQQPAFFVRLHVARDGDVVRDAVAGERQASGACVIVVAPKSDGTPTSKARERTMPRDIDGNSRSEEYDSQIDHTNVLNKIRADSPLELCAFGLLLVYVAVAPVPYGAITRGGIPALPLFAFATFLLVFLGQPRLIRLTGVRTTIAALTAVAILGFVQLRPMHVGHS